VGLGFVRRFGGLWLFSVFESVLGISYPKSALTLVLLHSNTCIPHRLSLSFIYLCQSRSFSCLLALAQVHARPVPDARDSRLQRVQPALALSHQRAENAEFHRGGRPQLPAKSVPQFSARFLGHAHCVSDVSPAGACVRAFWGVMALVGIVNVEFGLDFSCLFGFFRSRATRYSVCLCFLCCALFWSLPLLL
jgi:hypothetical protein